MRTTVLFSCSHKGRGRLRRRPDDSDAHGLDHIIEAAHDAGSTGPTSFM